MRQTIQGFGLLIVCLIILFQLAKYSRLGSDLGIETWIAVFSILFLGIGIVLSRKMLKPKEKIIEKEIIFNHHPFKVDEKQLEKLGLSKRELESQKEMYSSPFFQFIVMFFSVFIVGIIITIISTMILRRKGPKVSMA